MKLLQTNTVSLLITCFLLRESMSFSPSSKIRSSTLRRSITRVSAGWLDDLYSFFGEFWKPQEDNKLGTNNNELTNNGSKSFSTNSCDDDSPAGTTRIVHIPVQSIKPGGLRLFLMFYLLGKQKSPEGQRLWRANQLTTASDEFVIEFFFHDGSAMLTVELTTDEGITIDRVGSLPSTAYMIHESSILDGILDELHVMAFDQSVALENRLLILPEPQNAIDKARETVAFG
ncbi:hypothetical protein MPSEU_001056100 [Mayamaea pseudoterrestris]|nr:hypothetical protein MPSEU_001056100 [Mayamaea pseudoterrestris]